MVELLTEGIFYLNANTIIPRSGATWPIIQEAYAIMRVAVPILIVVLSTIDFLIAIAKDEEQMKVATNKFIKRLVLGVLFFLIPLILDMIFAMTGPGGIGQSGLQGVR